MIAQKLRKSILQAAIQGKLTEQLPEDGDAKDLLIEIKKNRKLTQIDKKEIFFDIPENWCWVRLGEILDVKGGKRIPVGKKLTKTDTGCKYIRVADMHNDTILDTNIHYVPLDVYPIIRNYTISSNDLYITVAGSIGRVGIIPQEFDSANLTENADKLVFDRTNKYWLLYTLQSPFVQTQIIDSTTKVGQPKLAINRIENLIVPLPPLTEQKRIVEKIDVLLSQIDVLKNDEIQLDVLQKNFPKKIKDSILLYAIQGRLTEQFPEDGDARELVKGTQEERIRLIKEGKIKADKTLPPITEDEIPFDIPYNWCWTRLGEIGETNIGLTYSPSEVSSVGTLVLRSGNIQNNKIDYSDSLYVSCEIPESKKCHSGDIIICARNGSKRLVGKSAIVDKEGMTFGAFMALYRSPFNKYVHVYLCSSLFREDFESVSTTTINQITQNNLKNRLIPLPPIEEQNRIVSYLEKIIPLCDGLI